MKNAIIVASSVCVAVLLTVVLVTSALQIGPFDPENKVNQKNNPSTVKASDDKTSGDKDVDSTPEDETEPKKETPKKPSGEAEKPKATPVTKTVSFAAVGDNLIHSSVYEDAKLLAAGTSETYNFKPMYDNVKSIIQKADLAFVNQEGPIAGAALKHSGYPLFNAPDEAGQALIDVGFDIINLANNHMLDKNEPGYLNSIKFWKDKPVTTIGGYESEADYNKIRIVKKNDLKIAFLSYTYGTNGMVLPAKSPLYIPLLNKAEVDRQTKEARKLADVVIVSVHWGVEDEFTPNATQKEFADLMVKNGVDVILGQHPHVLQPIEWKDRPDGGKTLIAYSLGNFLSTMQYSRNMVGGILTFDIKKTDFENARIENAAFIPTVTQYNRSIRGLKIYKFSEYTAELEKAHGAHKYDPSMTMPYMRGIIDKAIPQSFLIEPFYQKATSEVQTVAN